MTQSIDSPPFNDPWVTPDFRLTDEAYNWLQVQLLEGVNQTPGIYNGSTPPVALTGQNDAITTRAMALGDLPNGYYRVTTYLRVTTADGVSSSVQVTLGCTTNGVAVTQVGTALTSDTVTLPLSQTFLLAVDSPGPITYATAYSSNTANQMVYALTITVERVQ